MKILALIATALVLGACSESHQDIYNYDKLYLTSSIDSFKMGHFKKHVSENIVYLNTDPQFVKSDLEDLCKRNSVRCFIHDLRLGSKNTETELKNSMAALDALKGSGALIVSSSKESAALLFSAYAYQSTKASEATVQAIASDIGASPAQLDKILSLAKGQAE